jgi:NitT/TauT family transport system permease protein
VAVDMLGVQGRRGRAGSGASLLLGAVIVAALLGIWELAVEWGAISALVLPRPSDIGAAVGRLLGSGELGSALLTTLALVAISLALATVVGVFIGYLLYRSRVWGTAFEPILGALFASPLPLMYPIFLVLFGRTLLSIVVLSTIYAAIPIIMNTREALLTVRRVLIWVGQSFNASETQIFWRIIVPAASPIIFGGIRLGVIYAVLTVVAFEFLTDLGGLGKLLSELNYKFRVPDTFAVILAAVIVSAVVLWVTSAMQRRLSHG